MSDVPAATTAKQPNPGLSLALDYGPLIVFFLAYKFANVFVGTTAFMAAIVIAVVVSKLRLGRVSPMLWISAILVVGFGGMTLYLHDPKYIQIKPTVIYALLSALLFGGLFTGRPLLKYVLEVGYQGLTDRGWMLLSRNWAIYFLALAVANEVLRASVDFDTWLTIKVWGVTALSLAFGAANLPMLMRHGLDPAAKSDAVTDKPVEG
ncbi:septation protein IspZ [Sphingomonas koreensis]|nr:septation protein IspZ [Sphingomonas koreensis]